MRRLLPQNTASPFHLNCLAFQKRTLNRYSKNCRKSLSHKGYRVLGVLNPYISYILYRTSAGKDILNTLSQERNTAWGLLSYAALEKPFTPLSLRSHKKIIISGGNLHEKEK